MGSFPLEVRWAWRLGWGAEALAVLCLGEILVMSLLTMPVGCLIGVGRGVSWDLQSNYYKQVVKILFFKVQNNINLV